METLQTTDNGNESLDPNAKDATAKIPKQRIKQKSVAYYPIFCIFTE